MIQKSEVLSVKNNGFKKGEGFNLLISLKAAKNDVYEINAFFKPRKQSFLIDKITKVKGDSEATMNVPVELDNVIKT